MTSIDFRPPLDEPPVHDPRLLPFVDAARAEPPPLVGVDAQAIYAEWQQRRSSRRRAIAVGLGLAAVLLLAVGLREGSSGPAEPAADSVVVNEGPLPTPPLDSIAAPATEPEIASPDEPALDPTPVLLASIHVSSLDATPRVAEVLGPTRLRLADGRWSVESESDEPVVLELPDGPLELRGGSVLLRVAGDVVEVQVLREQVLRVDAEGHWTALRAPSPEPAPTPTDSSPAALAREAEALMAAGDRAGAIRMLRRLVTRHGRSPAAQAGLIDLGRLLKAAGQLDEARCAYGMFLERWPGHALAGDVTRARAGLGEGRGCDGLRPRG